MRVGLMQRLGGNAGAVFGAVILASMAAISVLAPVLSPGSPWEMAGPPMQPPLTGGFLFGTDMLGRDVLAGMVHGARISLIVGLTSTLAAISVGVLVGGIAGYVGGRVDDVLMRLTEFFQAIPGFILSLLIVAIFQPTVLSVIAAVAVISWPPVARVTRAQVQSLRSREFVHAARLLGQSHSAVLFGQILPNTMSPLIVLASFMVATAILIEAALSFLGLGDPNVMSWGFMIGAGKGMLRVAWWVSVFPGVALFLTVLALNLVGEGLSDALRPRQRGRR
jgi:peptide/nickel transport system permease protein